MDIIRNFPFFSIMLCMFCAIISSVLSKRAARVATKLVLVTTFVLSLILTINLHSTNESFVFLMGHFPAPWGNEIRAGQLEGIMAMFVCVVAFSSITAGQHAIDRDVEGKKVNLYYILTCLMTASLLALIYTNDLFTGYVFIEINTIAGCGLIMIKNTGKSIVTAIRYMVVSLIGSGLFLIGVTLLYSVTGHLLMQNIQESVSVLHATGQNSITLTVITGLMTVGLCIKSGLFPFHLWIPDAYGSSNVASSSMLSGMVSKGYIFLLIKVIFRVIGYDVFKSTGVFDLIFILGIIAMIMGSVSAIRQKDLRRMIAFSSIAQIGYIFMGIGLGTAAGVAAAIFHIIAHGITKSLLFLSSSPFTGGSHKRDIIDLYGLGHKYKLPALAFTVGSFSIIGIPLLAGFVSKLLLGGASIDTGWQMYVALAALAVSTILNVVYFLRVVINLYTVKPDDGKESEKGEELCANEECYKKNFYNKLCYYGGLILLVGLNFFVGLNSQVIVDIITKGLNVFD